MKGSNGKAVKGLPMKVRTASRIETKVPVYINSQRGPYWLTNVCQMRIGPIRPVNKDAKERTKSVDKASSAPGDHQTLSLAQSGTRRSSRWNLLYRRRRQGVKGEPRLMALTGAFLIYI